MRCEAREGVLEELVRLSRRLGDPTLDLVILAEGNTSARDGETFWVKASGVSLHDIGVPGLVQVSLPPCLEALDGPDLDDAQVRALLARVRLGACGEILPSVETFMHAYLLTLPGVAFVGHVHPTALLSLLCLQEAESLCSKRLFPDEIVCCGRENCYVPYTDPGLPLARAIRQQVERFRARTGETPKILWLQNHGLIALGGSAAEVESAVLMSVKTARIWLGILGAGGTLTTLSPEQIERIDGRPDEHYRQRLLWKANPR
ncbi:MAG TPA: class II aldolase/adducin family protein [Fimbriimonadaceae bacterium]|nr:class II aldolase/adducin family protein [Fimbriimonadaceae bacterium]